jgi:hypothetical protein
MIQRGELFTVDVRAGGVMFPAIYKPHSFRGGAPYYGCVFNPTADVLALGVRMGRYGVRCNSKYPPEVECGNLAWLVPELAQRDARNVGRDSIFRDHDCILTLRAFEYHFHDESSDYRGTGLWLEKVRIVPPRDART